MAEAITTTAEQMELLKSRIDGQGQDEGKPIPKSRCNLRATKVDDDDELPERKRMKEMVNL